MATERVQKPLWQPSSQKKQSPIVPPLIDSQTEADSLSSPKLPVSGVKSKAERDAIRRSLFEKWAGAAPQQMSASEVLGHGGLSTETDTIQGQEASEAKDQMGMPIQAKLTIGKPGDKYEQEADRVAAQVVNQINAPTPPQPVQSQSDQREAIPEEDELQMKPEAGIMQREEMLESEEELQMKPIVQLQPSTGGMTATSDLETSIQQARGSGQSLADTIRQPMEQAFGADFSGVKVHTDAQSDQLNQSIQARAFTTGQDIFFRQGEYDPGSQGGQELIAHELTHVVQQNGSGVQRTPLEQGEQKQLIQAARLEDLGVQKMDVPTVREEGKKIPEDVKSKTIKPFKAIIQAQTYLIQKEAGTQTDPFPIDWPKPAASNYMDLYLGGIDTKHYEGQHSMSQKVGQNWGYPATQAPIKCYKPDTPNQKLFGGETIGLAPQYQIKTGSVVGPLSNANTPGGAKINTILKKYGYDPTVERADGDHVQEIQFGGIDIVENLWPLDVTLNRGSGGALNSKDVTWDNHPSGKQKIKVSQLKAHISPANQFYFKIKSTY